MAYQTPKTIKNIIQDIEDQKYVIPAIQREFVWSTEQIENLFDSLLRDYPISTFLFWEIKREKLNQFKFFRFIKDYHQRDRKHNDEATFSGENDLIAILDGQQRLTSLYIGLKGSYSQKLPNQRVNRDTSYQKKYLYVNLFNKSDEADSEYDFIFLSEDEAKSKTSADTYYFKVGDILNFIDYQNAYEYPTSLVTTLNQENQLNISRDSETLSRRILGQLFNSICSRDNGKITYYLETSDDIEKVLQIFIRINSGGTQLNYSDLLLSIATAQWRTIDARKTIHEFVDTLNDIGKGFNFNKDFVLKSCLVLSDIPDIKFKVDNFSLENMRKIEDEWEDKISKSLLIATQLVSHFGFDGKTLTATNALIPIAYFIKSKNLDPSLINSNNQRENRSLIHNWLIRVLLKRIFGGSPDNLYPIYRNIIQENGDLFPLDRIIERYSGTNKSLDFYPEEINNLMEVEYGNSFAFLVLSLFYSLGHYEFHQDHIHPKSLFTKRRLESRNIPNDKIQDYLDRFNNLPNLQLLQSTVNQEKSAKPLQEWLTDVGEDIQQFKSIHMIPNDVSLEFSEFLTFYEARKKVLISKLNEILRVRTS